VNIRSPDVDLQGSIEGLAAEFLNVSTLLRPSCEARAVNGTTSSLYVAKAAGLPVSPEEWLLAFDAPGTPPVGTGTEDVTTAALNLARAQQASGAYGESLATLTKALSRAENLDDPPAVAGLLAAAGNAQQALGQPAAAEKLLTRGSLVLRGKEGSPLGSWIETDLGNYYATAGVRERARAAYTEAIAAAERGNDALAAAKALANAARLALESGSPKEAMGLLERADERVRALPERGAKAAVLIHLGRSRALQAQRAEDAELHGASLLRAHALFQSAAELARKLGDPRLRSYALGNLGALYQSERRHEEALALTREATREAERAQSSDPLYRWHRQEGQLLWAQGKAQPAAEAYRRAVALLEETRQESRARYGERADSFSRSLAPVYLDLADVLLRSASAIQDPARVEALLIEARATVEQLKAAELRNYLRDDCSAQLEARTASLDSLASGAAVVYPIALRDRLELLVRLPSGLQRYSVPVGGAAIEAEARKLRLLLQDRTSAAYRPVARQLYDWLVRPYAGPLGAAGVETVVFVPSGALRSIPMSALHDGERFLAERFAVATAPGLSLVDPRPLDPSRVTPLLGGVSDAVQEFEALKSVPRELSAIQEIFGGKLLLDGEFQADTVQTAIRESRPTLVHLASHAVFTGDPSTSFVLTHDGRMTMGDLAQALGPTRYRTDPVELLVLSACDTAVGDDRAALGLAGVAVRSGARSALGSLWATSDAASYPMMVSFYKNLKQPGTSRAAALRRAQREMLASEEFAHPFFWSTFVLISNWL
jgi:CHAT domain-containing protein